MDKDYREKLEDVRDYRSVAVDEIVEHRQKDEAIDYFAAERGEDASKREGDDFSAFIAGFHLREDEVVQQVAYHKGGQRGEDDAGGRIADYREGLGRGGIHTRHSGNDFKAKNHKDVRKKGNPAYFSAPRVAVDLGENIGNDIGKRENDEGRGDGKLLPCDRPAEKLDAFIGDDVAYQQRDDGEDGDDHKHAGHFFFFADFERGEDFFD